MPHQATTGDTRAAAQQLLQLIRGLMVELRPEQEETGHLANPITLDSSLDRDLGFDSLARVELLTRAEQAFAVNLSEQLLSVIDTPRDLLREVLRAGQSGVGQLAKSARRIQEEVTEKTAADVTLDESARVPSHVQTLQDILEWHVQIHPDHPHIYLYHDTETGPDYTITYADLNREASRVAVSLLDRSLEPGQKVALMLPTCREYFSCFFGVLLAKGVPVPIYPPARPSQVEDHLRRHAGILENAQVRLLITVPEAKGVSRLLQSQLPGLRQVLTAGELLATPPRQITASALPLDTAFLQYTSGSTGNPKGVVLSHANLMANIRAIGQALHIAPGDVAVSWLPLYHDMGLIGAWFVPLYFGLPLVIMSPLQFLARPERWLWAIHRYRGSLSGGPNFSYELCLRKIEDKALEGLDLSSWRFAFNGAEPVSPGTIRQFTERFEPFGFRKETMAPVYGLAEASVALAFPPAGRSPLIDRVDRERLSRYGSAVPVSEDDESALEFVASGQPLPGHQLRIVDNTGRELPDRSEGRLEFRGPSATSGYYRSPEQTRKLFHGDWVDTGDRGYLAGGDIYITGRVKDIIIRAGRNLYPQELEAAVSEIPGIRKGCVAVFASLDVRAQTEQLVVLAETRETSASEKARLLTEVNRVTVDLLGNPPDRVVLAPPQTVPKTSSGKIRRAAARALYESGDIGRGPRALWLQLLRLAMAGVRPQLYRLGQAGIEVAYGVYVWLLVVLLAPPVGLVVAFCPNPRLAWNIVRRGMRLLFRLTATSLKVRGLEYLSDQQTSVLIANHASYLDVPALIAALPSNYTFVAKREFARHFVSRRLFTQLQVEFVDRFDLERGVADARRMTGIASAGRSLFFFPEGTFTRVPGLRPFHMGAFVAAAEAGVPVVPIALRGSRSKLRESSWLPRRGGMEVIVGEPIYPQGSDWTAAVNLRDRARAECLYHCGEPDLMQAGE